MSLRQRSRFTGITPRILSAGLLSFAILFVTMTAHGQPAPQTCSGHGGTCARQARCRTPRKVFGRTALQRCRHHQQPRRRICRGT